SNGIERLWLAIANPAGPEPFLKAVDLKTQGLAKVVDETLGIVLVPGNWDYGRAELHLVRANLFFKPKEDVFVANKDSADYVKFKGKCALVLDDVGNPNHEGGTMILCRQPTRIFDDAVLTKQPHCAFPLAIPGISDCPIPALYLEENRPVDAG